MQIKRSRSNSPPVQIKPVLPSLPGWVYGGLVILGVALVLDLLTFLLAEGLWFQDVGYLQVFWSRVWVQGGLGVTVFALSLAVLWGNLAIARRQAQEGSELRQDSRLGGLRLRSLLPLAIGLSLLVAVMVVYHGQIAITHWRPSFGLYNDATQVPRQFRLQAIGQVGAQLVQQPWLLGLVVGMGLGLLIFFQVLLWAIALLMSLGFALVLSDHWTTFLLATNPTSFNRVDPLFGLDIAFYACRLPLWELLTYWVVGLFTLSFISACLVYLLSNHSLSDGKFLGFSRRQRQHLCGLGGWLLLAIALSYWLDRYELLYSTTGVAYGAGYTNATVNVPLYSGLSVAALILSLLLLRRSLGAGEKRRGAASQTIPMVGNQQELDRWRYRNVSASSFANAAETSTRSGSPLRSPHSSAHVPNPFPPLLLYLGVAAIATYLLPTAVQGFIVQPNELALERPYLERTLAMTREGFDLEKIQVDVFDPQTNLTAETLRENALTIDNIRLWDTRPLLETNRQLQRIRPYYEFLGADIDRYVLPTTQGTLGQRQVLIAARELDYSSVPAEAQTWVNEHLIYTHGYGFTLSPVNTAVEGGLPDYFVQGIEQAVSDPRVRQTIPIGQPRIYFGELTNTYVMVKTQVRELDYPSGGDNVYNTYDGQSGIGIGAYWRRLTFAKHLRDWRMLFSEELTSQSRLLFRRNVASRVRAIAPFLQFDADPYLVVADVGQGFGRAGSDAQDQSPSAAPTLPNYLYWVIDGYTTSDRYPYSDPDGNGFNYIRNSVKVVVDASNGAVQFFVADERDPLIQSWSRVFPGLLQPLEAMPLALRNHIRYPQDFYRVQADQLMTYHMTDPQVFYNREDEWRAPSEIYGDQTQLVNSYYVIMELTGNATEEFVLLQPFTPAQRNNLIGWLAARSDGSNYGKMLLYQFPKQELVFGTEQIEARINQDPIISQQISLWNRRNSRAIQGNLLVIPIERSLLYVEPLYLQAEQNKLPTLVRVIVAYGNRIVMAETLQQALDAIFGSDTAGSSASSATNSATNSATETDGDTGGDTGGDTETGEAIVRPLEQNEIP